MSGKVFVQKTLGSKHLELHLTEELYETFTKWGGRREMTTEAYISYFLEKFGDSLEKRASELDKGDDVE